MHVRVVRAVELGDAVDDRLRLLGARAGIQEHEAGIALEDREVAADRATVESALHAGRRLETIDMRFSSRAFPARSRDAAGDARGAEAPRTAVSMASTAKASISMRRATIHGKAARAQIEERRLVEVADGGAMAALDVVGEDLELGLGVDRGARAQQQVAVELMGVGLVGAGPDRDLAEEDAVGAVVDHALEDLARLAAERRVLDEGRGGRLLLAPQQIGAAQIEMSALARQRHQAVAAGEPRAGRQGEALVAGTLRQARAGERRVDRPAPFRLDLHVSDVGALAHRDPRHRVGPADAGAGIGLHDSRAAAGPGRDRIAQMERLGRIGRERDG